MNQEALQDLYQEVILDHSKHPRGRGRLAQATCSAQGHNPLCGDAITLFLQVDADRIVDISFEANGCAISVASASLMSEMLRGKSIEEAQGIFENFHAMLTEGSPASESLGELQALAGVRQFPVRIKCATLAWHALKDALAKADSPVVC